MNQLDTLPDEILHQIAGNDMQSYCGLLAYPRFARLITNGMRFDYAEKFGIGVQFTKHYTRWTLNGQSHRADGPAVIWVDGSTSYYYRGKLHRARLPASINAVTRVLRYCKHGALHREDGPAIIYLDGYINSSMGEIKTVDAFYLNGKKQSPEQFAKWLTYNKS